MAVRLKITNATTLRELQQLVCAHNLVIHVDYVVSAAAYRATISSLNSGAWFEGRGIGSTIGEAIANALINYEEKTR